MPMETTNINQYNTAIIGAGCAGLTLAYHLINSKMHPTVLFDPKPNRKDHIWSYWDNGHDSLFLPRTFIKKKWNSWAIKTQGRSIVRTGKKFQYVALSSDKYESHLLNTIKDAKGKILRDTVIGVAKNNGVNVLKLSTGREVVVKNVFDSRPPIVSDGALYQHFVGWTIQTNTPTFDDTTVILMDFRVSQEAGIHFIYLLPFSETSALIESTVYSTKLLPTSWYERQIKGYIEQNFPNLGWKLLNKEYGAIPLNKKFQQSPYGVPIGLNANAMRSSTGYAFSQIIFLIMDLIKSIDTTTHKTEVKTGSTKLETLMDKIFLSVLSKSPEMAPEIFSTVLESLTGDEFAKFMTGYCPASVKLKIIKSLPKSLFLRAAVLNIFE